MATVEEEQMDIHAKSIQETEKTSTEVDEQKLRKGAVDTPAQNLGSAPLGTDASAETQICSSDDKVDREDQKHSMEKKDQLSTDGMMRGHKLESDHSSRKRRYDDSDHRHRYEDRYPSPPEEAEEEFDDSLVALDKYNSDMNMKLHRDRLTGQPLTLEGFAYVWAGAKATYGVKAGKVCFECKLAEEPSVRHLPSSELIKHGVRIGWSAGTASRLLGEEGLSYAYCGSGKKISNKTAQNYGECFRQGDVIASYLNFSGQQVTIAYARNGTSLGTAFTIEKAKLANVTLFPHILCKNTSVEMNFGQKETPFFPHPKGFEDYLYIASVPREQRERGRVSPSARKDCEVVMLCGLPGAGKTFYANSFAKEHVNKSYNVLGTDAILRAMSVSGLESKTPKDLLLQQATNCMNRLMQVACRKKRNFLLDQTNVYSSAQRRRMRQFDGFQRKAIVIVPPDEEYKRRVEKRGKDANACSSNVDVCEMKANFSFPEVGDLFDGVIYAELEKEEARKLIESYREEAREKCPPPRTSFRGKFVTSRTGQNQMLRTGCRSSFRGGMGWLVGGSFNRFGNHRSRGDNNRGTGGWSKENSGNRPQNRNFILGRGGGSDSFQPSNRGGYGDNRSLNGNRHITNQDGNLPQDDLSFSGKNGSRSVEVTQRNSAKANFSYQQTCKQQTTQFSHLKPAYQQQRFNPHGQQPDYSQQWAHYYQQQAALQLQPQSTASAVSQHQNYYVQFPNFANQNLPNPAQ